MSNIHLDTGTAADLLSFELFRDSGGMERMTRVATANEEWVVRDWDGEVYYIHFDKNFSKKHLVTFSKDENQTREAAYYAWLNSGQTTGAGQNWEVAEHSLLGRKMESTVLNRSNFERCTCGHAYNNHANAPAPIYKGRCNAVGCGCLQFRSTFVESRIAENKPVANPLAGMKTSTVTFIVLNWVPKSEFENIVCQSIQAHEKQPGWVRGNNLDRVVGDEVILKWDFGPQRHGAIVKVQLTGATMAYTTTKYRGCYLKAKKTGTDWGRQTWEIFHMESQPPHAPF